MNEPRHVPRHPCRKDCEGRTPECKKTCERWKEYEKIMHREYEARKTDFMLKDAEFDAERRRGKEGCYLGSERGRTYPRR